jgi:hypothetical protein
VLLALTISAPRPVIAASEAIDGISFADDPHMLFVPVEEIASALGWEMQLDQESGQISLNGHPLDAARLRKLTNGSSLVPLDELQHAGATITWSDDGMQPLVARDHKKVAVQFANKHVEVDLANQRLRAYQGARLVLDSHISSGREGKKTPSGEFKAGPVKSPMHRSRLYHNTDAMERAGAGERFHSRIPEGPATSRFARLHSLAAGGRQSGQVVLRLDRCRHAGQH